MVPVSLADQDLKQYSGFFVGQRVPVSVQSQFRHLFVNTDGGKKKKCVQPLLET